MKVQLQWLRQAALSLAAYGPTYMDWAVPGAWPSAYVGLAPAQVVNFCGGIEGNTTWNDVAQPCAEWVVKMLRCSQGCNQVNRMTGFGDCMNQCSGKPDASWCTEPKLTQKVKAHCQFYNEKWQACNVNSAWASSDEWFNTVDKCVYNCTSALETEKALGSKLSWRLTKCGPLAFACGGQNKCSKVQALSCAPPVGLGQQHCYYDDPGCGDGCVPPAPLPTGMPGFLAPAPAMATGATIAPSLGMNAGVTMAPTLGVVPGVAGQTPIGGAFPGAVGVQSVVGGLR